MKIFLALVSTCLLLFAFRADTSRLREAEDNLQSERDTIMVGNRVIRFVPCRPFVKSNYNLSEFKHLLDDPEHVSRRKDTLRLLPEQGKAVILINGSGKDDMSPTDYVYYGDFDVLNSWLIYINYYEGDGYMLINKTTGERRDIYSIPRISPDNKRFVCGSYDLSEAQFNPNGIQVFRITGKEIKPYWQRDLTLWGPTDMRWADDTTVLIRQRWPSDTGTVYKHVKMVLKY